MKEIKKVPSIITIAVLTAVTIVFWIGFGVYRVFTDQPSEPVSADVLAPLTPTLDLAKLQLLEQRLYLQEGQIGETVLQSQESPQPTPTATPLASPTASPAASPTTSPTASPSGGLNETP